MYHTFHAVLAPASIGSKWLIDSGLFWDTEVADFSSRISNYRSLCAKKVEEGSYYKQGESDYYIT